MRTTEDITKPENRLKRPNGNLGHIMENSDGKDI